MAEDAETMRLAFEQFMMSQNNSSSGRTTPNTNNNNNTLQRQKQQKQRQLNRVELELKRSIKKYHEIHQKFCNKVKITWIPLDDELKQVVHAIRDLRHRLFMESNLVQRLKIDYDNNNNNNNNNNNGNNENSSSKDWIGFGYRHSIKLQTTMNPPLQNPIYSSSSPVSSLFMTPQDAQMALSHDSLQHEKMMEGLRKLFANLSECQEALSRILDEMMKHDYEVISGEDWLSYEELQREVQIDDDDHDDDDEMLREEQDSHIPKLRKTSSLELSMERARGFVDTMNLVFSALSLELYRKQNMAQKIFGSVQDTLLQREMMMNDNTSYDVSPSNIEEEEDDEWYELSPSAVADKCCKQWGRNSKWSHIDVVQVQGMLQIELP